MGRKLSSWERAARAREKERERSQNAARRDRERRARAREREEERQARKRATERERLARKRAKEEEEEENRREAVRTVKQYDAYVKSIKSLHLNKAFDRLKASFKTLSQAHPFDASGIKKPSKPVEPVYVFKRGVFSSPQQAEFENVAKKTKFNLAEYAGYIKKPVGSIPGQIFAVLLLNGIGAMFVINGWIDGLMIAVPIITLIISFANLSFIFQIIRGKDKNYASKKGFEKFLTYYKGRYTELEKKIASEKIDFEKNEDQKEQQAIKAFEAALHVYSHESIPAYERAVADWESKLAKARAAHQPNEDRREQWLSALAGGDVKTMTEACELLFPVNYILDEDHLSTNPSEFDIGYEVVSSDHLRLCVLLPEEYKFLPEYEIKLKPSGREATEVLNSDARQNEATAAVICGVPVGLINLCFQLLPSIQKIDLEVNGSAVDPSTGDSVTDVLIAMSVTREEFSRIKLKAIDPVETVKKFAQGFKKPGSEKKLDSIVNKDEILWSTPGDDAVEIDSYVQGLFYASLNDAGDAEDSEEEDDDDDDSSDEENLFDKVSSLL